MSGITYAQALGKIGAAVPAHLVADAEVPVLTGPQRQGDLSIWPAELLGLTVEAEVGDTFKLITEGELLGHVLPKPVPDTGIQVVVGEATGNTHWLHRGFDSPGITWARIDDGSVRLGIVMVPEGQTAELIHTEEHGANAMGPGLYMVHGKREGADVIRRVAD